MLSCQPSRSALSRYHQRLLSSGHSYHMSHSLSLRMLIIMSAITIIISYLLTHSSLNSHSSATGETVASSWCLVSHSCTRASASSPALPRPEATTAKPLVRPNSARELSPHQPAPEDFKILHTWLHDSSHTPELSLVRCSGYRGQGTLEDRGYRVSEVTTL